MTEEFAAPPRKLGPGLRSLRLIGGLLQRLPRKFSWLPVLLWLGVIWGLSSLPSTSDSPSWQSGWFHNFAHAPIFGMLALWIALSLPREQGWPRINLRAGVLTVLAILIYACIDEWHQSTTPGRVASLLDVLTDGVGASLTLWMIHYLDFSRASERGLWMRIAAGLLLCLIVALLATL